MSVGDYKPDPIAAPLARFKVDGNYLIVIASVKSDTISFGQSVLASTILEHLFGFVNSFSDIFSKKYEASHFG